jgi:CelD/BcsL family acetyltransferase involved in cellulose biosynthesis
MALLRNQGGSVMGLLAERMHAIEPPAGGIDLVRLWTEEEFAASGGEWDELVARSDTDPLFMGWDWQRLWWRHHKAILDGTLSIIACYSGSRLVGLAPFYLHAATHRAGLRAARMEIIGSTFRDAQGVFSEYLDVIADRGHVAAVASAVAAHLREDGRWSDLVVGISPSRGVAAHLVRDHLTQGCEVREVDPRQSHRAELPADFQEYLRSLASGTRRKVWNQRVKLIDPSFVVADSDEVCQVFDRIDAFHRERWHAPQYVGVAREFHYELARVLQARGALRLSTLYSAGSPIAVMYNIRLGDTEYNIQSGFDAAQGVGMSPGYLHFGYCLEEACRDGVRRFDFLAGQGRHRQYKRDFVTTELPLLTFQVIRARHLKVMYRAHGLFIRWFGK